MSDSEDELGKLKSRKKKLQEIKIKNTWARCFDQK
jgi:hypothetical protein